MQTDDVGRRTVEIVDQWDGNDRNEHVLPFHRVEQQIAGLHTGGQSDEASGVDDDSPFVQNGGEKLDHVRRIDRIVELGQIAVVRYAG